MHASRSVPAKVANEIISVPKARLIVYLLSYTSVCCHGSSIVYQLVIICSLIGQSFIVL